MSRKIFIPLILLGFLLIAAAALFAYGQRPGAVAIQERMAIAERMLVRGEDRIDVATLAQRLVEDRGDFLLVDTRSAQAYAEGHIAPARHSPLSEIVRPEHARDLAAGRTLILYGEDTAEAAQAATLLRLHGLDALAVQGGYAGWMRFSSDPDSPVSAGSVSFSHAERQALACLFHGDFLPSAGIPIQETAAPASTSVAYTPEILPVSATVPAAPHDPLGLGLHLGVGTVSLPAPHPDPLGLGLHLGLGVGIVSEAAESAAPAPVSAPAATPAPASPPAPRGGLRIGEGC